MIGTAATITIAALSGYAAVYTEKVLKRSNFLHHDGQDMLAYMQIMMALASLLIIGVVALVKDFKEIVTVGLWHGFDYGAILSVVSSALGGLIVSAVLRYSSAVLKGYATSASVILTGLLSALLLGGTLDLHFVLAVVNVVCSIVLYGHGSEVSATSLPAAERR